jgi:acetylornithine/N-succinyldiaminopimelate aminotransferase
MLTNRQLFLRHLGQTSPSPMMLEIVRAEGVFMYGPEGQDYIDLISGVSVSNTGHGNLKVIEAIKDQVDSYMHLMVYGEMIQSPQVKYAERLAGILPPGLDCIYFVNSGSEAVEGALKLAKRYTGKSKIISFKNSYHGSTHAALSIQGSELYKNAFRPLLPDTHLLIFNDEKSLEQIDKKTACVIVEPVQGEAGVIYPEKNYLGKLKSRCNETGTLLIFDEIQTGFGRTGFMFALDRFGVVPDILLLAKALGGGMPLGAFISSKDIMASLTSDPVLGHITTFGGHPVCCAAGLASLNVIIDDKLVEASVSKSLLFKKELSHPLISEIRGEGFLMAVQLNDKELIHYVITNAPGYGLILDYFLFCNNAFRIAPPLIISDDEIIMACTRLKNLLDDAMNRRKSR